MEHFAVDTDYQAFLSDIKQHYRSAQLKAVHAVNQQMIQFYWHLGKRILEKQAQAAWGGKFLEQLSQDLRADFPGTQGFSVRNLHYMRKFAALYPEIVQQPVAQLPWGHLVVLIEQDLYARQGKQAHKLTNFAERLPAPQSDLALQLFKDPYDFRFLSVTESAAEQEIEQSMVNHLRKLLLELGTGFAYMGNQYKLTVDGQDFFLDMLFYHVRLRCYFVIELKATELKPEHVGKLNFYLAVVNDVLRAPEDHPSIGLLLCRKKSKLVAEYALKRTDGPIGVADYRLLRELPQELQAILPPTEILESRLSPPSNDAAFSITE